MVGGSRYRYEVQIDNKNKSVKGVTYSYQTTRFYGKATLVGVWSPAAGNLVMKEEKMEDLKIQGGGEGCLMTCYLDYRKEGDREILEGTYTSRNMNNGSDCGGGRVFLERVTDSDFKKEDFLKDNEAEDSGKGKIKPGQEEFLVKTPAVPRKPVARAKKPAATTAKTAPKPGVKKPAASPVAKATDQKPKTSTTARKPTAASTKKPTPPTIAKNDTARGKAPLSTVKAAPVYPERPAIAATKPALPKIPPPAVLKQRQNELFQTITTSAKQITISFYDNGEIDGDTISVYDNNRLLVRNRGLSANPITVTVQLDENESEHEIVMVAENLGSIPPNTALMIVQAGKDRYNVRLSSNEQKNAMVRFTYKPD